MGVNISGLGSTSQPPGVLLRRNLTRLVVLLLAAALVVPLVPAAAKPKVDPRVARLAASVTIHRDSFGVPHVYGPTDASCVFGYVYSQAEDNFWQIEDSYIHAIGRASEVYGDRKLASDLLNRALEIPRLAQAEYERSSPRIKELLQAVADGLNYFLARNPNVKPRLITEFEPWHVFAFGRFALYQLFIFNKSGLKPDEVIGAVTEVNGDPAGSSSTTGRAAIRYRIEDVEQPALEPVIGSNMWAVSPAKTTNGRAKLFINPHQPFFGPGQWYEGHLVSDEGWNISGASFFGSGFPTIGHNGFLGWSHTVNDPDIADVYIEKFDDAEKPLAYRHGDKQLTATEWTGEVKIKGEKGFHTRAFKFRKTVHGPIVAVREGNPLSLRLAGIAEGGSVEQWYMMSKSRSMSEFKSAMSRCAIPMFNTMYADREGNIFYVYNGSIPKRSTKFDWRKPVDGSNPETDWQGYHGFDELPQLTNPATGFMQNCNQTPFTTTTEGNPAKENFPEYMVRESDNGRARISRRILSTTEKFSFEDWERAAFDTTVIEAETQVPQILADWEKLKTEDGERAARLEPMMLEMKKWNFKSSVDSTAMTLYALVYERATRMLQSRDNKAWLRIRALEEVLADLNRDFGTWQVAWGEINRLQRVHTGGEEEFSDARPSLPVAGAPGWLGIVFNFYTRPEKGQKRRYGVVGHSFVAIIDFGEAVKARSLLVFGQSADPRSPHYFDQARLYSRQEFKPAWYRSDEVKKNAKLTYKPGEKK